MASSELGYIDPIDATELDGDQPAHAGMLRRLIGNINHIADQYAQRRVSWAPIAGIYFEPEVGAASIATGTYYRCWRSTAFDLHVTQASTSYALRCRLHGARSGGAGTVTFRLVVAAEGFGRAWVFDTSNENVSACTTSSATHAWLTLSPATIVLTPTMIAQARMRNAPALDSVGGDAQSGEWLRCTAEVWASTTSTASVPRASGLVVDEYYAP